MYIADTFNSRIRRIWPDGTIGTVVGNGSHGGFQFADGGPPEEAFAGHPDFAAVAPDGTLYIGQESVVRRVSPILPGLDPSDVIVASEDGSEVYVFTGTGRHLRTVDALTGATLYEFAYDSAGLLASVTDSDGNVTTIERDSLGNATAIVAPFGQRTELVVDANGHLVRIANPTGDTIRATYTADGLMASFTGPRGHTSTMAYDSIGRLTHDENTLGGFFDLGRTDPAFGTYEVSLETALGVETRYKTENLLQGVQRRTITAPNGLATVSTRELSGRTTVVSPDSTVITTTNAGDPRFGLNTPLVASLTVTTPGGLTSTVTTQRTAPLNTAGDPFSFSSQTDIVHVNGRQYTTVYQKNQRRFTTTTPVGRQTFTDIDSVGRVVRDSSTFVLGVHYAYDAHGRPDSTTQGGRTIKFGYDAAGLLASVRDPLLRTDSFHYDPAGRLTRQVLPDGREILYGYDAAGNLTSLTPPGRPAHTFTYNEVDLVASYTPPDVGGPRTTSYSYNLDRQLTGIARPDGRSVDFGYDSAGRLDTLGFSRGALRFSYSPTTGNLTGITAPGANTLAYTYDGSLLTGVSWAGEVTGSVDVGYDNDFRVAEQRVNGADTVAFGYDDDGLLASAGALTLSRSPANGLLTGTTLGGVTTSLTYNGFGELASQTVVFGGTDTLYRAVYTRDLLGRITRKVETVEGVTDTLDYAYDAVGRLEEVKQNGQVVESYTYDANGNRLTATYPSGTVAGTYDDQDRLLTYGNASYSYTAAGELQMKVEGADTTRYTYDELGNLVEVVLPESTVIEYVIDAQNRRVGKKVNGTLVQAFLYGDQLDPVAELDSTGAVVARFVYGSRLNVPDYMVKGGVTYRIVADQVGSVRLVVDAATGHVAQRIDYDAFGRVEQNTNLDFQPFGFAGRAEDGATRLIRFGLRDYDPITGRWTAKDPVGFDGGASNLFEYAGGNPITLTDPSGKIVWVPILVGAGIGFASGLVIDLLLQILENGGLECFQWDWGRSLRTASVEAALGAATGGVAQVLAARKAGQLATFYRGVNSAEAAQAAKGAVKLGNTGSRGKYLTDTAEAAGEWGHRLHGADFGGVVEYRVSQQVASQFDNLGRVDGIGRAWYASMEHLGNAIVRLLP